MSKQRNIEVTPKNVHVKHSFSLADLNRIEVALSLRVEACMENDDDLGMASKWQSTLSKVYRLIDVMKASKS